MSAEVNEQQEEEEVGMLCSLFVFMEKIDFSYSIDTTLVFVGPPCLECEKYMYTCLKKCHSLAQGHLCIAFLVGTVVALR